MQGTENNIPEIKLAHYRVYSELYGDRFLARVMTKEEAAQRRVFIRSVLKAHPKFRNMSNESLDNIRLCRTGEFWTLEDENLYEYALGQGGNP